MSILSNIKSVVVLPLAVSIAVITSACTATLTPEQQTFREEYLAAKKDYAVSGKLGIFDEKVKTSTLLNISVSRPDYTIYVSGITGTTLLKIRKTTSLTEITDDKGNIHTGSNAEELVYNLTGFHIPCDSLPDIVTGIPGNNPAHYRDDGTIESIEFSEFTVNYKNYKEVNGILLPKKIDIKGNNFLLRIAVNKWEI